MKQIIYLVALMLSCASIFSQTSNSLKSPSSFFGNKKIPVLVVGTFHFNYPNLDVIKTNYSDKIDVLTNPKKEEITQIVNYIKKFKPTKIAIEADSSWGATDKLRRYKKGELRDKRDERYQLGIRIAAELNLDTLFSIDAESLDGDLIQLDSIYFKKLFKDFDFATHDTIWGMYKKWFEYEDRLPSRINLLEYLKRINSREHHRLEYGAYLVGDFKLDNQRGADILSIWWYNRNLRIFRKLQEITQNKSERILLIFGNGHAAVLRQLLESSPEYEFIEFSNLNNSSHAVRLK